MNESSEAWQIDLNDYADALFASIMARDWTQMDHLLNDFKVLADHVAPIRRAL